MHASGSEFEKLRVQFNILRKSLEADSVLDLQILTEIRRNIFLCDCLITASNDGFKSLVLLTYRYWLMCYELYKKSSGADPKIDSYKPPIAASVPQHDVPPDKPIAGLTEKDKQLLRKLRIDPDS